MKRKDKEQTIQILAIAKWFAKFAIYIIIYHLIVRFVFDYKIIYMKVEKYEELERSMERFKKVFWWLDFDS